MEISQEDAEKILNVSHDATEEEILEVKKFSLYFIKKFL